MFVTTLNIKNNPDMPAKHVREDARRLRHLGRPYRHRVALLQEIGEDADHDALSAAFPRWHHVHKGHRQPIMLSPGWQVLDKGAETLHGGLGRVSPRRTLTWVIARPRWRDLAAVAFINVHYVSGAYSNPGQRGEEWRRTHWGIGHAAHAAAVAAFTADGFTVLGGGDFNRRGDVPDVGGRHFTRWIAGAGYDHLYVVSPPNGVRVSTRRAYVDRRGLHTDHPAVSARLDLRS